MCDLMLYLRNSSKDSVFQLIKNVIIVGTGALATYFAVKLSNKYKVTVVGSWNEGVRAISKQASLIENGVKFKTDEINGVSFLESVPESQLTIWLTKTYKNLEAAKKYKKMGIKSPLILIQNGIGQKRLLEKVLVSCKVYDGFTSQAAKLHEPGVVENTGEGKVFVSKDFPFSYVFNSVGIKVIESKDFEVQKLRKLAVNAVVNPLCAIHRISNGELLQMKFNKERESLMEAVYPYFQKRKVFNSFEEMKIVIDKVLVESSKNVNSMLADIETNRETEIEAILSPINDELNSELIQKIISQLIG